MSETVSGASEFRGKDVLGKPQEQSLLNVLRMACAEAMQRPDFAARVQDIKQKFYVRDFDGIFLEPSNLSVYTAQYVPRRALCYYDLFSQPQLQRILQTQPQILCLGAGSGSELLGITAACCQILSDNTQPITIHSQDYADWSPILQSLENAIRYKWNIRPSHITYEFSKDNLLSMTKSTETLIENSQLVTAMFVFGELFADKANAINFVKTIVRCTKPGAFFLLVDSAGSFSSIKVGSNSYMAYMFFDSLKQHFEPVISDDSKWFRHARGLDYPLPIENMRYFLTDREAALLTEYELIRNEVKKMGSLVAEINEDELDALTQSMRSVEQKMALVYTVFRSSIYAHLSQQEISQTNDAASVYSEPFQTNCPPFD
ncbi:hypothetical protein LPJ76_002082 [Coemansia sp. RSA 638]|nr:hypothetical protein LPJ76_002082 [Coemansia sp. RSA 638]